jgi:hypothetical protein
LSLVEVDTCRAKVVPSSFNQLLIAVNHMGWNIVNSHILGAVCIGLIVILLIVICSWTRSEVLVSTLEGVTYLLAANSRLRRICGPELNEVSLFTLISGFSIGTMISLATTIAI